MASVLNSDFGNFCLVCCEKLERASKWIVVQNGIGIKPVDALIKICDVLQVSFEEIQGDWQFKDGDGGGRGREGRGGGGEGGITQALPFCGACLSSFRSVVKLEDQLVEIRKKIREKLDSIRDTIRRTNQNNSFSSCLETDPRAQNFRSKAVLIKNDSESAAGNQNHQKNTTNTTELTVNPAYQQQISFTHRQITHPPPPPVPPTHQLTFNFHPNHNPTLLYQQDQATQPPDFSAFFDESGEAGSPPPSPQNAPSASSSDEDSSNDYYQKRKPSPKKSPPKPKPPRSKISKSTQRVTSSNSSRRKGEAEHFSPITYDPHGRMLFENIPILPCPKGIPGGYICGQCNATIGSTPNSVALRKAKIHIKGFHLLAYQCPQCSKNFTSNDILNQHLTRYHATPKSPCPTCGKLIKGLESAMRHHQFTHMNSLEKKAFIASGFKPHTTKKPNYHLPCRICSRVFATQTKLKAHEETHIAAEFRKDFKCDKCDRAYTQKKSLEDHILSHHSILKQGPKRTCKYCGKVMFQSQYKNHVKLHNERKFLTCKICERKKFGKKSDLERHEKICANYFSVRSHECDICGGMFKTRRILLAHRRIKHKGDRRTMVGKKLEEIVYLEESEERALLDEVNNEGLCWIEGDLWSYQVYEIDKLGGEEEDGWRCRTCGEEFGGDEADEEVKRHVREKHMGPYRCNKCTKSMKTLHEAQVHHRTDHLGLYSHECEICGRTGIASKMIGRHMWGHRSVQEAVEKVNEGEIWPRERYNKQGEMMEVLRGMGVEVEVKCVICGEGGMGSVGELYEHRVREHKEAKVVRVNRIREEDRKKRGRKGVGVDEETREDRRCPLCGKEFMLRKYMLKHGYRMHKRRLGTLGGGVSKSKGSRSRKEVDTSEEEEEEESEGEEDEETGFGCDKCEERFESEHERRIHERKEHLGLSCYSCEICGGTGIPEKSIMRHKWSHKSLEEAVDAVNQGQIYPLRMYTKTDEYQRVLEEMGEVEIKCGICGEEGMGSVGELYEHRVREHKEAKVLKVKNKESRWKEMEGEQECDECGKVFKNRKRMRAHRYKVHRKKKKMEVEEEEENEVEIKEEIVTEEEGEDGKWMGGVEMREEEEEERNVRRPRRSNRLNVSYVVVAEEDEEMREEVVVKQSPPSSEEEDEQQEDDWIMGY